MNDANTTDHVMWGFEDQNEVFEYTGNGHYPEGSVWFFKANQDQKDKELRGRRMSKTDVDYDPIQEREDRKQGKRYRPKIETKTIVSGPVALVWTQSLGWKGEAFRLPTTIIDPEDPEHRRRIANPDPYAGQVPPCELKYILNRPPDEISDIDIALNEQYDAMTPEEVERFRSRRRSLAGPPSAGGGEGRARISEGANGLSPSTGIPLDVPAMPDDAAALEGLDSGLSEERYLDPELNSGAERGDREEEYSGV